MLNVLGVAGARPNFVKIAALHAAFSRSKTIRSRILHTGQHYDAAMSDIFFEELELPRPDIFLGVGSGSHAVQTARVMTAFEEEVSSNRPDVVIVVGDVNSTAACALVCAKMHIPVAHVEAGLRSGDRSMPEEINRIVTDAISDQLFVTEQSGVENLRREGVPDERIHFVGNVMIDSLVRFREKAAKRGTAESAGLPLKDYVLMTMHRPATVDVPERLARVVTLIEQIAESHPIVLPLHPRTEGKLEEMGLMQRLGKIENLMLSPPYGYMDFLNLMMNAGLLITDSGGVQEETTYLRVPCITLRPNTERPSTVEYGTNVLLPLDLDEVLDHSRRAMNGEWKEGQIPPLWDGRAAERIAGVLEQSEPQDMLHRYNGRPSMTPAAPL